MISKLKGKTIFEGNNFVIIDVSGVGYKVFIPNDTLTEVKKNKENTDIWTYLAVRENSLDLYGFLSKEELDFFEMLISISGIGPKSALGILNVAAYETLISAIATGDTSYLTKVSGIGSKSAQKIILELKDKVEGMGDGTSITQDEVDVIDALKALGYSGREVSNALKKVEKNIEGTGKRIKEALKILNK